MDPRHESLKEGFFNHMITSINTYIQSNTDTLVVNKAFRQTIYDISSKIYAYLGVTVDINGILSIPNLLSIDTVMLPVIPDPESSKILNENDFSKLINEIESCMDKINENDSLRKNLSKVLDEFKTDKNENKSQHYSLGKR